MTIARLSASAGIPLRYANRHGLITGQTGTGKTVSLMRLIEQFSEAGVPCLVSDVKSDISALARSCPVALLDCFGQDGAPLNVPFSHMGADLAARALDLTDTQAGCLEIAFAYASATRKRLDTIADLRAVLLDLKRGAADSIGTVSGASVGVIQRALLRLEGQGGNAFFRSPAFDVAALLAPRADGFEQGTRSGEQGQGLVSILQSERLIQSPRVYAAFLLWLLDDLWNRLPEVGDMAKPRLALFFDESHLLFKNLPTHLLQRIEQTVRLIRSKGVGVYFVTQSPADVPDMVREQLAHKLAHDRTLGVGVASLETMDSGGRPQRLARIQISPPTCPLGPLSEEERPAFPAPSRQTAGGDWERMGLAESLLLAAVLFTVAGCGAAAWHYLL